MRRDTVMMMLALANPEGTAQRRCRRLKRRIYRSKVSLARRYVFTLIIVHITQGPNYVWHCDGYDKLKPYGIAIHGCIDGYIIILYT